MSEKEPQKAPESVPPSPPPARAKRGRTGRPSKFTKEITEKIFFLAKKGLTDAEIAMIVDVNERTITEWKKRADFSPSLKASKEAIDAQVEGSLLSRALGYEYEEEFATKDGVVTCKKRLHPETTACIFWLKNRKPKDWRDKTEVDHGASDDLLERHKEMTNADLFDRVRSLALGLLGVSGTPGGPKPA